MTREEAKRYIIRHCNPDYPKGKTEWEIAINMAIKALEQPEQIYGEDIYYEADGHCEFKCSVCGVEIGVVEGGELDGGYFKFCPKCGVPIKERDDDSD